MHVANDMDVAKSRIRSAQVARQQHQPVGEKDHLGKKTYRFNDFRLCNACALAFAKLLKRETPGPSARDNVILSTIAVTINTLPASRNIDNQSSIAIKVVS